MVPNNCVTNYPTKEWKLYSGGQGNFSNEYSPLFIDLIDDYNQRVLLGARYDDFEYANDSVKGYDLATLNNILIKSHGLESLSKNLKKQKPNGVTDSQIDNLINSIDKYYDKK